MIDLEEAGRRLAAARLGPTPPLDALLARGKRRTRRRRLTVAGSTVAVMALVAVIVGLVATGSGPGPQRVATRPTPSVPTVTLPPAHSVPGSVPYDFQRARLWLPAGWTTSTNRCHRASKTVYFPADYTGGPATSCTDQGADIIVVRPFSGANPLRNTMVNGIAVGIFGGIEGTVNWWVPSLQVQMSITGEAAENVAETLEASPLQDILTTSFPTVVPTSWQTVTYHGFRAKVPPGWSIHHITFTKSGNSTLISGFPGTCDSPTFTVPAVFTGPEPAISCPAVIQTKQPPAVDGLWLQPSTDTTPLPQELQQARTAVPAYPARLITIGREQILIQGQQDDSISVEIDYGGHRIAAVIGLGANPAVAEAILTSIAPTSAATSPATSSASTTPQPPTGGASGSGVGSNSATPNPPPVQAGVSSLPASASKVMDVPISALAAASQGTTIADLTAGQSLKSMAPLTYGGKPELLYIGAEFSPWSAAERWPLVAALSKFGTFANLGSTTSSGTDTGPNTPTFSFYGSTYTSPYLTFIAVETTTRNQNQPLATPTAAQASLWKKLEPDGTIPFIDVGNKYLISGATYDASSMANQSFDSVAAQVGNNSTTAGKGIDQAAGAMVKAICQMTGSQPPTVCSAVGE